MNDTDLSFDVDLPNKFRIEVTQNYEDANWYLCVYDNNSEHFDSYACGNRIQIFNIIEKTSKEEMIEYD